MTERNVPLKPQAPSWLDDYPERETLQIVACRVYKQQFAGAGLPGHTLMLIIAHMADQLDALERSGPAPQQGSKPPSPTPIGAARTQMATAPQKPAPSAQPAQPAQTPQPAAEGQNYDPATERQVKAVYGLLKGKLGLSGDAAKAHTVNIYGYPPEELSKDEASDCIQSLNAMNAAL